jgi:hypothetical protein
MGHNGVQPLILDIQLILEARRLKKNVISLESVETYCEVSYYFQNLSYFPCLMNSLQNFKSKV